MKKRYTLSIDPSINNLGYAIFDKMTLIKYGLLNPSLKSADYLVKCREMIKSLQDVCEEYVPRTSTGDDLDKWNAKGPVLQVVTEIPDHFATSGFMSRESGAVQKLSFLAGMIYNMAPDVISYVPRVWKGNWNKHVSALRAAKSFTQVRDIFLGKKPKMYYCKDCDVKHYEIVLRHDICDAIMIGLKYLHGKI